MSNPCDHYSMDAPAGARSPILLLAKRGITITDVFNDWANPEYLFAVRYFGPDGREYAYRLRGFPNVYVMPCGRQWSPEFKALLKRRPVLNLDRPPEK